MKLNHNSTSAQLYRWFYQVYDMPTNLCPYFWKLVFMYIFIIPYSIIVLPAIIMKDEGGSDVRFITSILIWAMIFFGFLAIYAPVTWLIWGMSTKGTLMGTLQMGGFIIWAIGLIVLATWGTITYTQRKKNQKYVWSEEKYEYIENPDYSPSFATIAKEFIKAKYHKYCPQITWNDKAE